MNATSADLDTQFERLRDEWKQLMAQEAAQQAAETSEILTRWEPDFDRVATEHRVLRENGEWRSGPRDLLTIINRNRRETVHTAILAWLMTPTGHHGFGPEFLLGVIARTSPSTSLARKAAAQATTGCEIARSRSRADILVWCPDQTIVIEAKLDAEEGHQQCRRLFEDWQHDLNPVFIFLSPDGRDPVTDSGPAGGMFRKLSFRAVRDELDALVKDRHAADPKPWGLAAAEDYLATLKKEFP